MIGKLFYKLYLYRINQKKQKMKIKLFLIAVISAFTFTSCEKCQDCEASYEFINGSNSNAYDVLAILAGYTSFDNLFHETDSINQLNKEYCDLELTVNQFYSQENDIDLDGTNEIRYFYDCK